MPWSDAPPRVIRPLQLYGVRAKPLRFPRTDVTDLAVAVVIPTLAWNRVRDRFAQLVRSRRRDCVESGERTHAASAVRIRHDCIKDLTVDVVVVAAEGCARTAAAKADRHPWRREEEVQRARRGLRHSGVR